MKVLGLVKARNTLEIKLKIVHSYFILELSMNYWKEIILIFEARVLKHAMKYMKRHLMKTHLGAIHPS